MEQGLVINPYAFATQEDVAARTLFVNRDTAFAALSEQTVYLPPVYREGVRRAGVTAYAYFVNPYSPDREAAMDLLAAYCQPEEVAASLFYWQKGIFPQDVQPFVGDTDPVLIELWNTSVENGYRCYDHPAVRAAYALLESYLAGEIDVNACGEGILAQKSVLHNQ